MTDLADNIDATEAEAREIELVMCWAIRDRELMTGLVACGMADVDVDHETHKSIWRVALRRHAAGLALDFRAIEVDLLDVGVEPDEAQSFMTVLMRDASDAPPVNLAGHVEDLKRRVSLRRMRAVGARMVADTLRPGANAAAIMARSVVDAEAIIRNAASLSGASAKEMAAADAARDAATNQPDEYIPLGLPGIDESLGGGAMLGGITIIGADSGIGKSTVARHIIRHACTRPKPEPTVLFTFEMKWAGEKGLFSALRQLDAGIAIPANVRMLPGRQQTELILARDRVATWPLWIEDRDNVVVEEVVSAIHLYVKRYAVRLVVVDYVQDIEFSTRHSRADMNYAHISKTLRRCAADLHIAIVSLSQIKEIDIKDRTHKNWQGPTLGHLPETKQWGKDAVGVVMLDRNPNAPEHLADLVRARSVKSRHGQGRRATSWVSYSAETTRLTMCNEAGEPLRPTGFGSANPAYEPGPEHDDDLSGFT